MNSIKEIVVNINEEKHSFSLESTIDSIFTELNLSQNGVAIAINEQIIPKGKWITTKLRTNDKILIITATQGG